ncbi:MAG: glycosyltransferase family 39 protein [Chloroflexi bacterium]|nr:glycosyltransferase family 39 protein [Chloroflexota bacterium]
MSHARQRINTIAASHWFTAILFIAILLLAAGLRFYRLDWIDFRFDQSYALHYANDITHGILWPVQPHGSVAVHPPVYLYVMALPYLFTSNFMTIVSYHVLLDVIAVGLCWLIGARYFNLRVGVISSFLYAVAPWAIQSARNTWPVPLPLFSAIVLIGMLEIVLRHNVWGWTLTGVGMALVAGTHLAGVYVLPVVLLACWIGRKSARPLPVILGILPLLAITSIYIAYDASQHFVNIQSILSTFGAPSQFSVDSLQFGVWMSGGMHLSDLSGAAYGHWVEMTPASLAFIDTIQVMLLAASLIVIVFQAFISPAYRYRKRNPLQQNDPVISQPLAAVLILLWWCVPILLQMRHSRPITLQYLLPVIPAPYLVMALGIDAVFGLRTRWRSTTLTTRAAGWIASIAAVCLVIVIGGWQIASTFRLMQVVEQYDTSQGYGLPVHSAVASVQYAKQAAAAGVSNQVILVIKDYATPWNEQAVILGDVAGGMPYRFLNSNVDGWVFRAEGTSYIFAPGTESLLNGLRDYVNEADLTIKTTPLRMSGTEGYTYVQVKGMPDLSSFNKARPINWENGTELTNYRITAYTSTVRVDALVEVNQFQPDNTDYHWYSHVFDNDRKLAQVDGPGIHPLNWRPGDYLLMRFDIPLTSALPNDPLYVRFGCYTFPQVKTILVSEDGKKPENGVNLAMKYPLR